MLQSDLYAYFVRYDIKRTHQGSSVRARSHDVDICGQLTAGWERKVGVAQPFRRENLSNQVLARTIYAVRPITGI